MQFDSLSDAVKEGGNGIEVYTAKPRRLGCFKIKTVPIRLKKRKKAK